MCGIAGYFGKKKLNQKQIKTILSIMKNRGPDASDYSYFKINNKNLYLFHSRLKIIDLKNRSNQPFEKHDKIIIYNGEIYNFQELRKILINKGYIFRTKSDTEVIISGYDYFGKKIFSKLNGMWSIIIFDKKKKKLIFSRDIFGEKPLYIYSYKKELVLGSEIKFLEKIKNSKFKPNIDKIKKTFILGYKSIFHDNETFCKEIKIFPNGYTSILNLKTNKIKEFKYWRLPRVTKFDNNFIEAKKIIKKKIIKSVKRKFISDVPCGVSLSGGIDSSIIAGLVKKNLKYQKVKFFSLIDKGVYDESDLISKTEKFLKIKVNKITINYNNFLDKLRDLIEYYDSPISTITYFIQSQLIQKVRRQGVKVLLGGTGADEQFTGYYDHFLQHYQDLKNNNKKKKFEENWKNSVLPFIRNKNLQKINFYDEKKNQYKNIFQSNIHNLTYLKFNKKFEVKEKKYCKNRLKNRMLNELFHEITPITLNHEDLNCMKYSIENRSPFLDKEIINYSQKLDNSILINGSRQKVLLRETFKKYLHPEVYNFKQKVGFNASLYYFLKNENKNKLEKFFYEKSEISKLVNMKLLYKNIKLCRISSDFAKFLFQVISIKIFLDYRRQNK
jgi:asparagine synthase (glutamine-hydrolysing)